MFAEFCHFCDFGNISIFPGYDNIQNDMKSNLHQLKIMEHGNSFDSLGQGLAIKYMFRVTSVYFVSFNFYSSLVLSVTKVFLSLQVCSLMSL